jgi:hypothetical protein
MKFIVSLIVTALLSFAVCLYFPWWSIAIVAFLVAALIPQSAGISFLTGFLSLFLLWGILSFLVSSGNQHILAHKMSLVMFKVDSVFLLILVTGLIGGLVAGFAALTGSFLRKKKVASAV